MRSSRKIKCDRCSKGATYAIRGQLGPIRCADCTRKDDNKDDLICWRDRNKPKCCAPGCTITARYASTKNGIPTHCNKHKGKTFVNTRKDRKCKKCKGRGACYGLINTDEPIYCMTCYHNDKQINKDDYHRTDYQKCKGNTDGKNCTKVSTFAIPGCKTPEYCADHKPIGSRDTVHPRCISCDTIANYGDIDGKEVKYCAEHRPGQYTDMSSLANCLTTGCKNKNSGYYDPNNDRLRYCTSCGKSKSLPKKNSRRKCTIQDCTNVACYRKIGTKINELCKVHGNIPGYERYYRQCDVDSCLERAGYKNLINQEKVCYKHKGDNDISMDSGFCKEPECKTYGTFGDPTDEKKKLYCKNHKKSNHIQLKGPKCSVENCCTSPSFVDKMTKLMYCKRHSDGKNVGVIESRKCQTELCENVALFGILGGKATRCGVHKMENDRFRPNKRCDTLKCKELATHGFSMLSPSHCSRHAIFDEIDLVQKKCVKCNLLGVVDINGVCKYHDDSLCKKQYLQKQSRIKHIIENDTKHKIFSYDKAIDSKCSLKRPDLVIDCVTHFVVIEIDEMQHSNKTYTPECEDKRYVEIIQSLGQPTIFIRYNPDKYKPSDRQNMMNDIDREKLLIKYLDKCVNSAPKNDAENLRILHLFYDGFDVNKEYEPEIAKLTYIFKKE